MIFWVHQQGCDGAKSNEPIVLRCLDVVTVRLGLPSWVILSFSLFGKCTAVASNKPGAWWAFSGPWLRAFSFYPLCRCNWWGQISFSWLSISIRPLVIVDGLMATIEIHFLFFWFNDWNFIFIYKLFYFDLFSFTLKLL